jgi:hypothetical protein
LWYEAKSGDYWKLIDNNPAKLERFRGTMPEARNIAAQNGKDFKIISNTPIPQHTKDWLSSKGINFLEILE